MNLVATTSVCGEVRDGHVNSTESMKPKKNPYKMLPTAKYNYRSMQSETTTGKSS